MRFRRSFRSAAIATLVAGCTGTSADKVSADAPDTSSLTATAGGSLFALSSDWKNPIGQTVHLRDLAGRVSIVTMIYTSCQVTCPLIMTDLHRVESQLASTDLEQSRFVLVSLDPDRDTPGRLLAWSLERKLDSTRWWLLAGSDDAVREFAASVDVRYQRQGDGEIAHTSGTTVLDRDGRIVFQHNGLGGIDDIVHAVRLAVKQHSTSATH